MKLDFVKNKNCEEQKLNLIAIKDKNLPAENAT
jgi:hypothetical protein